MYIFKLISDGLARYKAELFEFLRWLDSKAKGKEKGIGLWNYLNDSEVKRAIGWDMKIFGMKLALGINNQEDRRIRMEIKEKLRSRSGER